MIPTWNPLLSFTWNSIPGEAYVEFFLETWSPTETICLSIFWWHLSISPSMDDFCNVVWKSFNFARYRFTYGMCHTVWLIPAQNCEPDTKFSFQLSFEKNLWVFRTIFLFQNNKENVTNKVQATIVMFKIWLNNKSMKQRM